MFEAAVAEEERSFPLFALGTRSKKRRRSEAAIVEPAQPRVESFVESLQDEGLQSSTALDRTAHRAVPLAGPPNGDRKYAHQAASTNYASPTTFRALGLSEHLDSVCTALGMLKPTPVQAAMIPAVLRGQDGVGIAETGSGKTAAFALPILHRLAAERYGVFALILSPTRELAIQIAEQFETLGRGVALRHAVAIGGLDQQAQSLELRRRPHVVIATPGRLAALLRGAADIRAAFARVGMLVLDEADRMLEASFEAPLRDILEVLPRKRQTLLFTATMTRPLAGLQERILRPPVATAGPGAGAINTAAAGAVAGKVSVLPLPPGLQEEFALVPQRVKDVYAVYLLETREAALGARSTIVFCATRRGCETFAALLSELQFTAVALHSGKPQRARIAALYQFKSQRVSVLVATDVASRGLDIPAVDLVLHYDLPPAAEDYVHRAGRTARAGRSGRSLALVTQHDVAILKAIEARVGHELEPRAVDEGAAMQGISRVFAARRAALLALERQATRRGM